MTLQSSMPTAAKATARKPEVAATAPGLVSAGSPVPVPTEASTQEAAASLVASPAARETRLGLCARCSIFYNEEQIELGGNQCFSCGTPLQAVLVQSEIKQPDRATIASQEAAPAPADNLAESPDKRDNTVMPDSLATLADSFEEATLPDGDTHMEDGRGNGLADMDVDTNDVSASQQPAANAEQLALMLQLMTQKLQKLQPDHPALNQHRVTDPSAHLQLALPPASAPATVPPAPTPATHFFPRDGELSTPTATDPSAQLQLALPPATAPAAATQAASPATMVSEPGAQQLPLPPANAPMPIPAPPNPMMPPPPAAPAKAAPSCGPPPKAPCMQVALQPPSPQMPRDGVYNSSTHPTEWAAYRRFCERNEWAGELRTAWQSWSQCDGMAMEAVMRFSRQKEEEDKDAGKYYPWWKILELHNNNVDSANAFVLRRRADEIAITMGLDPAYAASVATMISHNPFGKQQSAAALGTPDTAQPVPAPKNNKGKAAQPGVKTEADGEETAQPKKKARASLFVFQPFTTEGSDMEVHIMEASQEGCNSFVKSWIGAATTASGLAVRLTAELEPLESQEQLINFINAAVSGITDGRKKLQQLGTAPQASDVQSILLQVTPFVEAWKKHQKTAQSLSSDCTHSMGCNIGSLWFQTPTHRTEAAQGDGKVLLLCPVAGAPLLLRDLKTDKRLMGQVRRSRSFRARQAVGKAKAKARVAAPKKKSRLVKETPPVRRNWPVFLPHQMLQSMVRAGMVNRLSGDLDWCQFWRQVIKSDLFAYKDGRNLTLEKLQETLAMSLNKCNLPGDASTQGWSMHLVVHKGDWKFRREWLCMQRHYNNADLICPRCLASALPNAQKPWLDPCRERFNNQADLAAAALTRLLKLSVDAVSLDFPLGFGKAYANRVMAGRIYVETYAALAQQALFEGRPRYKMRPKTHQFHCELVLRMLTSRLNPRWGSCWTEEDYVGQITKIVKGSVHSSSISLRVLQRWQLHYNAKLAGSN
ncbi:TY1B-DR3 [Symbiodinium sp. CCMP2592]|nr:TY1B-DR3 [Symbiodinium sp. CCMP2592]